MSFDWILSAIGLLIGAGLGAAGLLNPRWAEKLVRLSEAAPGGFAEFRATYGGLFFGAHAAALALLFIASYSDDLAALSMTAGAAGVLSVAWAGSAFGRALSILRDKTGTKFNWQSVAFEGGVALLIGAPWFGWLFTSLTR
ncbi:MAG: hypothetical protein AB7J28_03065 [Hyphomonadaceae bacterium]